ncbi:MAG: tripartite tricarboxylate transporter TctB family protein [Chloroflexi bacterium]|nr:tripartite tricarboxylate transporter TctB family protein [Chloroflexota bacterium]
MREKRWAVLAVTLVGVVLGAAYTAEALRYRWGSLANPGPGLFPVLVGVLVMLGAVGVALETFTDPPVGDAAWPQGVGRWRLLAIVAVAALYVATMPYLGHPIAGTLVMFAALQIMGLANWPLKIGLALCLGLGSHYLFATWLGIPLPTGEWW